MKEVYDLTLISLGIRIHNLQNMIDNNQVYDFFGNNVEKELKEDIRKLQKMYNERAKEISK